jgi:nitric oxide dioxygenase
MLSTTSAAVVRATLPAVGGAIKEITQVFYRRMFAAHPELIRDLFNRGNQANGAQSQALAGAIAAFAVRLLEEPGNRPEELLGRIAHKHASLGVTAEQYTIVHRHLFAAIAEVLGDAVTPEVTAAWDEVFWLMGGALIAEEARLYAGAGVADGDVWRPWRVVGRVEETADVATFMLRPADGGPLPPFRPGQYISVGVRLPDGARQIRQYSLSCAPGGPNHSISVKRAIGSPDGEVSNWLHANVGEGDVLTVSAPFGDVVLDDGDGPVLLASGGIGCTPMMSMLAHLAATGSTRQVIVVHGDRSERTHPFRAELDQLVGKIPQAVAHVWYENPEVPRAADRTGLVDLAGVEIPQDVRAYLCGPVPYMRSVRTQLLDRGVPADRIHYEVFGPDRGLDMD